MVIKRNRCSLFIFISMFIMSCARPSIEKKTQLSLNFSDYILKKKASSGSISPSMEWDRLVINVTYIETGNLVSWRWDSCKINCSVPSSFPPPVEIEVIQERDILIQALVAYRDSSSQNVELRYGELNIRLLEENSEATVTVNKMDSGFDYNTYFSDSYISDLNPTGRIINSP